MQLRLHAPGDDLRRVVAVDLAHLAVDKVLQLPVGVFDLRREEPVRQQLYVLAHAGDGVGVLHHGLVALAPAEVGELLQHLVRGAEIERVLAVGVGEFLGRQQYAAVYLVLRVQEVHVAGGDEGLFQLVRKAHDAPVERAQPLLVAHRPVFHQETVVGEGHYLKVVVEGGDAPQLLRLRAAQHGVEHLARLAGGADEQPLAVLFQQAAGDDGVALVVLEVAGGDELVEVLQPHLVAHEQRDVPHAAVLSPAQAAERAVDVADALHALLPEHGDEAAHHARHHLRVVIRAVVVELGQAQVLGDDVQLVPPQFRQQPAGDGQRVQHHGLETYAVPAAGRGHEAGVEGGVVGDDGPPAHEVEEGAHGLRLARRAGHVAVADAGEFRDVGRYGHAGIDEGAEFLACLAVFEDDGADLRQAVRLGGETGGLHVEGHELRVQPLVARAADGGALLHVVYVVALKAVEDLHAVFLAGLAHLGEGLRRAVVGDGHGLHPPGGRALDDLRRVAEGVQRRIAGVEVQLHALFLRRVRPRGEFAQLDAQRLQHHVVVELVEGDAPAHRQVLPGLDALEGGEGGGVRRGVKEFGDAHAARVVRHVKADDGGAALLYLAVVDGEHLAAHGDGAALQRQLAHVRALGLLQRAAEEQLLTAGGSRRALRRLLREARGDVDGGEAVLLTQTGGQMAQLRRRGARGEARFDVHRAAGGVHQHLQRQRVVQTTAARAQHLAAGEHLQEGHAAHWPASLSISSSSASQRRSSLTLPMIWPFLKSRPQPRPPATP